MPRWNDEDRTMLAKIRSQANLSMEKAAILMEVTGRTLARYENGVTDVPMGIAEQMAKLYKVSFEDIRQAILATKKAVGAKTEGRISKKSHNRIFALAN